MGAILDSRMLVDTAARGSLPPGRAPGEDTSLTARVVARCSPQLPARARGEVLTMDLFAR
jgi:hypothetical protein